MSSRTCGLLLRGGKQQCWNCWAVFGATDLVDALPTVHANTADLGPGATPSLSPSFLLCVFQNSFFLRTFVLFEDLRGKNGKTRRQAPPGEEERSTAGSTAQYHSGYRKRGGDRLGVGGGRKGWSGSGKANPVDYEFSRWLSIWWKRAEWRAVLQRQRFFPQPR